MAKLVSMISAGWPLPGGQVDEAALGQQVQRAAVGHLIAHDLVAARDRRGRPGPCQVVAVDLHVEVAGVGEEGVVLHLLHVPADDDVLAAGGGDKDIALRRGVVHWS